MIFRVFPNHRRIATGAGSLAVLDADPVLPRPLALGAAGRYTVFSMSFAAATPTP